MLRRHSQRCALQRQIFWHPQKYPPRPQLINGRHSQTVCMQSPAGIYFVLSRTKKLKCASGSHNYAMITDRWKFTIKIPLYGISSFHFYHLNQFKVIPLAWTFCTRNPQIFCDVRPGLTTWLTSLSRRKPITIDYWVIWHYASLNAESKQLVHKQPRASSRILYCGHSTQYSHLVIFTCLNFITGDRLTENVEKILLQQPQRLTVVWFWEPDQTRSNSGKRNWK